MAYIRERREKENIYTVPNALSIIRIVLTFVIILMIFAGVDIGRTIAVFVFAAITDFLDGQIARRFDQCTEFGRKADMIADRFLWIGTAIAFVLYYSITGKLDWLHYIQIAFIMSREIICTPFAIRAFFTGGKFPHAHFIAKVNTFIQGFALPALILSIFYPAWIYLSGPLSIILLGTGIASALIYVKEFNAR